MSILKTRRHSVNLQVLRASNAMPPLDPKLRREYSKLVLTSLQGYDLIPGNCRISLDPGVAGTGIAFWTNEGWTECEPPCQTVNLYHGKLDEKGNWLEGAGKVLERFDALLQIYAPVEVYSEMPEFFSSAGGEMVAKSGDLAKLTLIVGSFAEACRARRIPFSVVKVTTWKGQLSKEIVEKRIRATIPGIHGLEVESHSMDAVGIGLYFKGYFGQERRSVNKII